MKMLFLSLFTAVLLSVSVADAHTTTDVACANGVCVVQPSAGCPNGVCVSPQSVTTTTVHTTRHAVARRAFFRQPLRRLFSQRPIRRAFGGCCR